MVIMSNISIIIIYNFFFFFYTNFINNSLGYHTETVDDSYTSTDSDGNRTVHYQSRTIEITDFNFTFDLTEYVSNNGIIHTISKNNKQKDIMELLNEYVKNENTLKNIEMKKVCKL
jgi:hypothetical protein